MQSSYYIQSTKVNIVLSDSSLTISRKGALNALNHGLKGDKTIPFSSITSIQIKAPGFTTGYIQFSVLGGRESRGGVQSAVKDENTITFKRKNEYNAMLDLKKYIESRMKRNTDSGNIINQHVQKSTAEQIKEFKDLLDQGIISQEEFEAKKKQLLGL